MKTIVSTVSKVLFRAAMFLAIATVTVFMIATALATWPLMKRNETSRKMLAVGELLGAAATAAVIFFKTPDA